VVMGALEMLHIVCFGNYWHGDDGIGIHVFRRLGETRRLPPHVKIFDAGVAGLSALEYFEDCSKALVVDAMKGYGRIGSAHRLRLEDFDPPKQRCSMHALGVDDLSAVLPIVFEGRTMPEVVVIGAEIGEVRPFSCKLSHRLEAALDRMIRLIEFEILGSENHWGPNPKGR
jgi:hydrogenase maturation protease